MGPNNIVLGWGINSPTNIELPPYNGGNSSPQDSSYLPTQYLPNPVEIDPNKRYVMLFDTKTTRYQLDLARNQLNAAGLDNIIIIIGAKTIVEEQL